MSFDAGEHIGRWKPNDKFNPNRDRLMVQTVAGEVVILAWSSDDATAGQLILAPESAPDNIITCIVVTLNENFHYKLDRSNVVLFATQLPSGRLRFELDHPEFYAAFDTHYQVAKAGSVRRGYGCTPIIVGEVHSARRPSL